MKKRILCLMMTMLMLLSLGQAVAQGEEVTLTVLWFNDANESEVFQETVADYLEANPNVKLDVQVVAFDGYEKQLKLMLAGGNAPDLARMTTAMMPVFSDSLEPLEGHADMAEVEKAFAPAMLAFAKNKEGKVVAYPTEATDRKSVV